MKLMHYMQRIRETREKSFRRTVIWVFLIGLTGLGLHETREFFSLIVPANLIFSLVVLIIFDRFSGKKELLVFAGIALAGYMVEAIGVATGAIFGAYSYGTVLGPMIADTPPLIGINWLILSYCSFAVAEMLIRQKYLRPFFAAALMVALDILIEPVAIGLHFWAWDGLTPPLQNYIAWAGTSLLFQGALFIFRVRISNAMAPVVLGSMAGFFLLMKVILIYFG
jgi:bisanhydrobacterioruberin hydratase